MKRLVAFINSPLFVGLATAGVTWLVTSGLIGALDQTTLTLTALVGFLGGVAIGVIRWALRLRAELRRHESMAQFDPATGFFYWPTDESRQHPLCPQCSSENRVMALVRENGNRWCCPVAKCGFTRYDEEQSYGGPVHTVQVW